MTVYTPPVQEMSFALTHSASLQSVIDLPDYQEVDQDIVEAVLDEAAKLARDVWAPLNWEGDQNGAKITDHAVETTPGFKDAYWQFVNGGWNALPHNPEFGGQGLPLVLSMATGEMWQAANLSLGLCPLLTQAAIEAIETHGDAAQKALYLEKLISGEWTGTMNLTEPQAGTDLAAIRCTAKKQGDHYLITGQKIFITYGDHDFTENVIHLVLAHVEGLPAGNKGLGLFIVPKVLVDDDGSLGERNDLYPVSLEHKLGIHGSPTCVMQFGDQGGATGFLVGKEGEGLKNMFIMMNNARIAVGLQGVSICDRAYQQAVSYARERTQGFALAGDQSQRVSIIDHADVRRMLLTMRAYTEAARALTYSAGTALDFAHKASDLDTQKAFHARAGLLTPLVKSWATDLAVEVASIGIQIHGGMGFIEETGAAQYYRDARILPIYEGANGIQAMDLVFRKVLRDGGQEAKRYIGEMKTIDHAGLQAAVRDLEEVTDWVLKTGQDDLNIPASIGALYLRQFATIAGGALMAQQMHAARQETGPFFETKVLTAEYYLDVLMPQVSGLKSAIMNGAQAVLDMTPDQF